MKLSAIAWAIAATSIGLSALSHAQSHESHAGGDYRQRGSVPTQPQTQQQPQSPWWQAPNPGVPAHGQSQAQNHGRGDVPRYTQRHDPRFDARHDPRYAHRHEPRYDPRYVPHYEPRYDLRDGRWNARRDHYNARGPQFSRGGYIPREYRSRQYVVANYHLHRLPPPPRQHEWVQVGADYVLIAIATGIIAHIVFNY